MRLLLRFPVWLFWRLMMPLLWVVGLFGARRRRHQRLFLRLRLDGPIPDLPGDGGLISRLKGGSEFSLFEMVEALEAARHDPQVHGVIVSIRDLDAPWSTVWELRGALQRLRDAGKEIIAFAPSLDMRGYWFASVATRVVLAPEGSLQLHGLRAEVMMLRAALDRLGVKAEFLRAGKFKSFAEMFTHSQMSAETEESLGLIVDDLLVEWVQGVASGRGMDPAQVTALLGEGPFRAEVAVERGLLDARHYGDELQTSLEDAAKADDKVFLMAPLASYHHRLRRKLARRRPLFGARQVVVLEMAGGISEGSDKGVRRPSRNITQEPYTDMLRELKEDEDVLGVVLRIDSPGGSALVSDLLWREVARLAESKPVWVSMGATAASGGYYLAAPAARIYATPQTVTGSIGVVAGKFQGGNLLARAGVGVGLIERGSRAGMYGVERGFSEDERAHLQGEVDAMYESFLDRVSRGRKLSRDAAHEVAQGRIWSGTTARTNGLVDELGGMSDACDALVAQLGAQKWLEVVPVSAPNPLTLSQLISLGAQSGAAAALSAELPELFKELRSVRRLWAGVVGPGRRALAMLPLRFDIR